MLSVVMGYHQHDHDDDEWGRQLICVVKQKQFVQATRIVEKLQKMIKWSKKHTCNYTCLLKWGWHPGSSMSASPGWGRKGVVGAKTIKLVVW